MITNFVNHFVKEFTYYLKFLWTIPFKLFLEQSAIGLIFKCLFDIFYKLTYYFFFFFFKFIT